VGLHKSVLGSRPVHSFESPVRVAFCGAQSRNVLQSSPGSGNPLYRSLTKIFVSRLKGHIPHLFVFRHIFRKGRAVQFFPSRSHPLHETTQTKLPF